MTLNRFPLHARGKLQAFTLMLALIFIALISVVVIGFLTSMRFERSSAFSHLQGEMSHYYAQAANDIVMARIQQAMQPGGAVATQPGQIMTTTVSGSTATSKIVELHSGKATSTDKDIAVDLNLNHSSEPSSRNLITTNPVSLTVNWIYMRQDGSLVAVTGTSLPPFDATNPLVGRLAFWTDDGSSRVNLNTASYKPNPDPNSPPSLPSQVNLLAFSNTGLKAENIQDLINYRTGTSAAKGHYFNSLAEARAVGPAIASAIDAEKFSVGVTSQTPDVNIFGEPRIMLTTQRNLAGNSPFLDILPDDNPNSDPGSIYSLDANKVSNVIITLSKILARRDWPYKPGTSFVDKYAPVRVQQIAVNILDYVRSRESARESCDPIRGEAIGESGFTMSMPWTFSRNDVRGITRSGPRVTEFGFYLHKLPDTNPPQYGITSKTELCLPRYGGLDKVNLTGWQIKHHLQVFNGNASEDVFDQCYFWAMLDNFSDITIDNVGGDDSKLVVNAGEYRVINIEFTEDPSTGTKMPLTFKPPHNRGQPLSFMPCVILYSQHGNADEFDRGGTDRLRCPIDDESVDENSISTLAVDDPYTNDGGWVSTAGGLNGGPTLGNGVVGAPPNVPFGTLGTKDYVYGTAQQDTDADGHLAEGVRLPSPKGTTASTTGQMLNPTGIMQSVAELGFVHTGNDPQYTMSQYSVVPWRTLRLQPKNDPDSLPDWALLDMFSVPLQTSSTDSLPYNVCTTSGSTRYLGGRVNLNASIIPFMDGATPSIRSKPLEAIFLGVPSLLPDGYPASGALAATTGSSLADSVIHFTVASGKNPGNHYGLPYYWSRGELAEIDQATSSGEASEELLRNTVDLLTTRSNVFLIYSIGQSIKQLPSGQINVLAEKRLETIVSANADGSAVIPFYSRSLTP